MARRSVPFLTFAILAAILLWPLATGKVLLPASMLGHMSPWNATAHSDSQNAHWNALTWDGIAYFYPARHFLGRSLRSGELPLWNPHQMCGMPFLASPQSAVLYPPNWLFAILPIDLTFGLFAFLHLFAAGSFTLLLLRRLGLSEIPSIFGGTAFMLSGWAVTWLQLPVLLASGVWLPLTLYLSAIAWERRSVLHAALAGVAIALSLLGGHPQIWLYGLMAVGCYWVYLAIAGRKTVPALQAFGLAILMLAVGFLLAAPQLLPTMELASISHRGGTTATAEGYQAYRALAMPARNLIGLLIPDFYGNPSAGNYWGTGEFAEFCGYLGIFPLLLMPLAFFGRQRRDALFFGLIAAIALLMATGTDIDRLFYLGVPGFSRSGSPARVIYLYTFAVSILGATGLETAIALKNRRSVQICLVAAAGLVVVGVILFLANVRFVAGIAPVSATDLLASAYRPVMTALALLMAGLAIVLMASSGRLKSLPIIGILTIGLLGADLLLFGIGYNAYSVRSVVYPRTDATAKLAELAGDGRIMPMNDRWRLRSFPRAIMPPNAATVYGLFDVQGYDSLYPMQYKRLLDAAAGRDSSPPENGNIVFAKEMPPSVSSLLGVRVFLSPENTPGAVELSRGTYASESKSALPKAFLVRRTRGTSDAESLELIAGGEVDLRSVALVHERTPIAQVHHSASSGKAVVREYSCNRVSVYIDNPDEFALLVLTDQYYPGWTARIEERQVPVIRTDYCFRGVVVPRGRYLVRFSFEPRSFRNGLFLASVGLLIVLGTGIAYWRGGRS